MHSKRLKIYAKFGHGSENFITDQTKKCMP